MSAIPLSPPAPVSLCMRLPWRGGSTTAHAISRWPEAEASCAQVPISLRRRVIGALPDTAAAGAINTEAGGGATATPWKHMSWGQRLGTIEADAEFRQAVASGELADLGQQIERVPSAEQLHPRPKS
jgi:hypothetical protein